MQKIHHQLVSLIFLLINIYSLKSTAQDKLIKGMVYDEKEIALAWVNIGIRNKNVGTVSKDHGDFELLIPAILRNDTLTFSAVGYEELTIPVKDINEDSNRKFILHKKTYTLNEVVITHEKRKRIHLGTTGYTPLLFASISLKDKKSYAESAQRIKIKKAAQLLNVNARIAGSKKSKDSVTYRLNIYKMNDGLPGARLTEKNIIKTFPMTAQLISFDLEKESIFLDEDFVVAFEYIPNASLKQPVLSFRASMTGTGGFTRTISVGKWTSVGNGSASIFVEVEQ